MKNGFWTLLKQPYDGEDFFLPDLCSSVAVFTLIILAQLVVLVWVLAQPVAGVFDWLQLAMASLFVQWIVLLSAALLCRLRGWMQRRPLALAVAVCFAVVIAPTLLFTVLGDWVVYRGMQGALHWEAEQLLRHGLIALIMTSLLLRYFYLQQQWQRQNQAELRSRLQALQSRIRPHFLFNSLNSIASLIEIEPVKAEQAVLDLSDLFRANLARPDTLSSWGEERALCEGYLRIEQYRFGERMRVHWAVADLPDDVPMPLLTLQPLLENAILHGLQPRVDGGDIHIEGRLQNGLVELVVRNTCPEQTGAHHGAQMAMGNIRARLQALFGEQSELEGWREGECFFSRLVYPVRQRPTMAEKSLSNESIDR
ncbi:sensor histidine kinase [Halopseudomonas oceani]|uniref:sensor histidine kinase n=1 Tax=Halopseudomonas oceani TaxID=1708783 RepID=UPI002AA7BA0F|nr:sensor histidine kinase [Halopseudomonas oceani]